MARQGWAGRGRDRHGMAGVDFFSWFGVCPIVSIHVELLCRQNQTRRKQMTESDSNIQITREGREIHLVLTEDLWPEIQNLFEGYYVETQIVKPCPPSRYETAELLAIAIAAFEEREEA